MEKLVSGSGLHLGEQTDSACTLDVDFPNGESRYCGRGGSNSTCLLSTEQQKNVIWDCLWVVAAACVYLADVGTDVWLSVDYYLRHEYWWFGLTLFFVVLGSFSVQLFSFRWFVTDFSTEDNVGCPQMDGSKLLLSGSASQGEVPIQHHPATPQRQMSTASKNTANSTGSTAMGRKSSKRSPYYSFCVWLSQSLIHILQLGQIWR
ncbi:XK- protein 4 [Goodea atripinnis]|uniref:XK-related protein n=1 Tax=Goodea atripinnis TaxID=208336 RepID=A0ABV0P6R8_9TELE